MLGHLLRALARDRPGHRRLGLLHQPGHRPGPRPGHRLQPVRRLPLPGGAGRRPQRRDGRGAHRGDRRAHGGLQRPDRGRLAGGAAGLPALLPALLRLRRHRGDAGGDAGLAGQRCPPCWRCSATGSTPCALSAGRTPEPVGEGFWHRLATCVMRRPSSWAPWRWWPPALPGPAVPHVAFGVARRPGAARGRPRPGWSPTSCGRTSTPTRPTPSRVVPPMRRRPDRRRGRRLRRGAVGPRRGGPGRRRHRPLRRRRAGARPPTPR